MGSLFSVDNLVGLHSFSIYFPAASQSVCTKYIRTKNVGERKEFRSLRKWFCQKDESV